MKYPAPIELKRTDTIKVVPISIESLLGMVVTPYVRHRRGKLRRAPAISHSGQPACHDKEYHDKEGYTGRAHRPRGSSWGDCLTYASRWPQQEQQYQRLWHAQRGGTGAC